MRLTYLPTENSEEPKNWIYLMSLRSVIVKGGDSVGSFSFSSLQVSVEDHPMTDAAKTSECYLDGAASNQVMGGCGPLSNQFSGPGHSARL